MSPSSLTIILISDDVDRHSSHVAQKASISSESFPHCIDQKPAIARCIWGVDLEAKENKLIRKARGRKASCWHWTMSWPPQFYFSEGSACWIKLLFMLAREAENTMATTTNHEEYAARTAWRGSLRVSSGWGNWKRVVKGNFKNARNGWWSLVKFSFWMVLKWRCIGARHGGWGHKYLSESHQEWYLFICCCRGPRKSIALL